MNCFIAMIMLLFMCLFPASGLAEQVIPGIPMSPAEINLEARAPYYQPNIAMVWAGVPLQWRNATSSPHSIRHDGCLTGGVCAFQSPALAPSDQFMIAPLPPGRYPYHCELHPIMRGLLIVMTPGAAGAFSAAGVP